MFTREYAVLPGWMQVEASAARDQLRGATRMSNISVMHSPTLTSSHTAHATIQIMLHQKTTGDIERTATRYSCSAFRAAPRLVPAESLTGQLHTPHLSDRPPPT
ncbi:UNVERIFIED_CONTAM: hypothetical protein HHA_455110 [Hammondia hammondi]|eukprot:XP_008888880.1 hypothetical protein HHA_455110 [Hammondia hammondi]